MTQKNFQKCNIITGWTIFFIALITYALTVEPTLSFWDCGEYIATAAKLEIGHPPGAPFFQMVGAFFASFASSAEKIALWVNYMSVFSSAFTILFLYFIIVNLTLKITKKENDEFSLSKAIAVLASGIVGSLAYTFSDSFWFNAVEAEVYAMAMLFMSGMFWLGLKWTDNLNTPRGNKWLLLISLVVGLSFGVHFMALLTIPAIGMLYFFNSHYEKNIKNFLIANIVSITILLLIFKLILPYTLAFFGETEVFFVNSLGLPFNSGTIFAGIVIITFFVWALRFSYKKQKPYLQTITLCLLFVFVGFSSWLMIPIRANADVVINENSPTDARLLLAYYNLEQYPETHLFYGPMYSDKYADPNPTNPYIDEKPKYERDYKSGKYIIVNHYKNARIAPNSTHEGFLPRMWSSDHAANYMMMSKPLKFKLRPEYINEPQAQELIAQIRSQMAKGELDFEDYERILSQYKSILEIEKPSFWQNLHYLFSYQINYMYMRYFMWNFVGRQDDIQGRKDNHGNWLSGIDFIDEIHLGLPQKDLPSDVAQNKGRNTYFFLPLLLGLLGFVFHLWKSKRYTWVVFVLFMFTGIALKIYLNERPFEPRERDYALVGSFFTFSIWIGMGVYGLFDALKDFINTKIVAPAVSILCLLLVPVRMAQQNWDDHDRSNKYTARAMAKSYLDSVDKNKGTMLFSIGDNDTFSLWYMQEVENYRTDVRVINTSLLATDWYIDQMKRKAYTSEPIPSQLTHDKYAYGVRDAIYYSGKSDKTWNVKDLITWIASDDPKTKIELDIEGEAIQYASYPTNKIRIPVNKENVLKSGVVSAKDADLIVDYIDIDLPKSGFGKNRLLMLDIIANNDWKRPIYFTGGSFSSEEYIWMKDYLQLDGLVFKLVPIKTPIDKNNPYDMGRIDTELMYKIVTSWEWGNMDSPTIYHDPETRRNGTMFREKLIRLSEALIQENKLDKAKNILDLSIKRIPIDFYGYYFTLEPVINGYYKVGDTQKARAIFEEVVKKYQEYLNYYLTLHPYQFNNISEQIEYDLRRYASLISIIADNKDDNFYKKQEEIFKKYIKNLLATDPLKPVKTLENTEIDSLK
ncbi:DUF2723 domain-containing protein [Capnocytophaga catalasegens]|uniref:Membrane protein n=1 Tax=Capnocytophaga catalasegens TaxID=1004260 RepID=A0AAV5B190_9FLAO|nr:DUF2723 domain-containing protein [Capnocytophaga catalasegens]GIZ14397.1 membrane protein [Capnocytophaga catalasegens]GJM51517.1 membrane protein [Capnocytophaga catalasegens]GJM53421.1 membrane protein [Capnocytophaga catalasegens]